MPQDNPGGPPDDLDGALDYFGLNNGPTEKPAGPKPLRSGKHYDFNNDMIGSVRSIVAEEGGDPDLVEAMMHQESGGKPRAHSNKDARGVLQIIPSTGKRYGASQEDLYDPEINTRVATRYLQDLDKNFHGDKELMLADYNSGKASQRGKDWKRYKQETRQYVPAIMRNYSRIATNNKLDSAMKEFGLDEQPIDRKLSDVLKELGADQMAGHPDFNPLNPKTQAAPEHTVVDTTGQLSPAEKVMQEMQAQKDAQAKAEGVVGAGQGFAIDQPIEAGGRDPDRTITLEDYEAFKANALAADLKTTPELVSKFMKERGMTTGSPYRPGQPLSQEDIDKQRSDPQYRGILKSAVEDGQLKALKVYIAANQANPKGYVAPNVVEDYAAKAVSGALEGASNFDPTGTIAASGLTRYGADKSQEAASSSNALADIGNDAWSGLKDFFSTRGLAKAGAELVPVLVASAATGGAFDALALGEELTTLGLGAAERETAIKLAREAIAKAAPGTLTPAKALEGAMDAGVKKVSTGLPAAVAKDSIAGALQGAARNPGEGGSRTNAAAEGMLSFGKLGLLKPGITGRVGQGIAMAGSSLLDQAATGASGQEMVNSLGPNFLMGLFMPYHGEAEAPKKSTVVEGKEHVIEEAPAAEPASPSAVEGAQQIEQWVADATPEQLRQDKAFLEGEHAKGKSTPRSEYALQLANDKLALHETTPPGEPLPPAHSDPAVAAAEHAQRPADLNSPQALSLDISDEPYVPEADPIMDAILKQIEDKAGQGKPSREPVAPGGEPIPTPHTAQFPASRLPQPDHLDPEWYQGDRLDDEWYNTPAESWSLDIEPDHTDSYSQMGAEGPAGSPISTGLQKGMDNFGANEELLAKVNDQIPKVEADRQNLKPPVDVDFKGDGPATLARIQAIIAHQPAGTAAAIEAEVASLPSDQLAAVREGLASKAGQPDADYALGLIDERMQAASDPAQGGSHAMAEEKAKLARPRDKAGAPARKAQAIENKVKKLKSSKLADAYTALLAQSGHPDADYAASLVADRMRAEGLLKDREPVPPPKLNKKPAKVMERPVNKRKLDIPAELGEPTKQREYQVPHSAQAAVDKEGIKHEIPKDVYDVVTDQAAYNKALNGEKYGIDVDPAKAREIAMSDELEAGHRNVSAVVQQATSIELIRRERLKQSTMPEGERDWSELHSLVRTLAERSKNYGQAVQILKWLQKESPEGTAAFVDSKIEEAAKLDAKRNPGKATKAAQVQADLAEALDKVHEATRDAVADKIATDLGAPPNKQDIKYKWTSFAERMQRRADRAWQSYSARYGQEGALNLGSNLFAPGSPLNHIVNYAANLVARHGTHPDVKADIMRELNDRYKGAVGQRHITPYADKIYERARSQYIQEARRAGITPDIIGKPAKEITKLLEARLAKKPAKPPTMERLVAEHVNGVISEFMPKLPRTPKDYLSDMQRLAENFPHSDALWDKVIDGLSKSTSQDPTVVAQAIDLARKLATQGGLPKLATDQRFVKGLSQFLAGRGEKLNSLIRAHYSDQTATRDGFIQKLLKDSFMSQAEANQMADLLTEQYDQINADKQTAVLKQKLKSVAPAKAKPIIDKLIEVTNLSNRKSPAERQRIIEAYAKKIAGLPSMTPDVADYVLSSAEKLQEIRKEAESARAAGDEGKARNLEQDAAELTAHMMKKAGEGQTLGKGQALGHGIRLFAMMNPGTMGWFGVRHGAYAAFEGVNAAATARMTGAGAMPTRQLLAEIWRKTGQAFRDAGQGIDTSSMYGNVEDRLPQPEFKSALMRKVQKVHDIIYKSLPTGVYEGFKNERMRLIAKERGVAMKDLTAAELEEAHQYGLRVALQDKNFVNATLDGLRRGLNVSYQDRGGKLHGIPFGIGDLAVLFSKAPGSSILRGSEMMGGGLVSALPEFVKMTRATIPEARSASKRMGSERLGRAVLGMGAFALTGYLAGRMGAVLHEEDDPHAREMMRASGITGSVLNLSQIQRVLSGTDDQDRLHPDDTYFSLSGADPFSMPFLGYSKTGQLQRAGQSAGNALWGGFNEGLGDSQMLSNISGLAFDKHKEGSGILDKGADVLTQGSKLIVPSIIRSLNRWTNGGRNVDTTDENYLIQLAKNIMAEIPGVSNQMEERPSLSGRPRAEGGTLEEGFNRIMPHRVGTYHPNPTEAFYLQMLHRAASLPDERRKKVIDELPKFTPKEIYDADGNTVPTTPAQRRDHAKYVGGAIEQIVKIANTSETFARLEPDQQAGVMGYYMGIARSQADILVLHKEHKRMQEVLDKKMPADPAIFEHNSKVEFAAASAERKIMTNPILKEQFMSLPEPARRDLLDKIKLVYQKARLPEIEKEGQVVKDTRLQFGDMMLEFTDKMLPGMINLAAVEDRLPDKAKEVIKESNRKQFGTR